MPWTPSVFIGIGGSGKWVLTHLKKRLCDANEGLLPPEISLLALDVDAGETGQPIPWVPDFRDGKQVEFWLNYQQGSLEWLQFDAFWAQAMNNLHNRPYLRAWIHPDDVTKQHIAPAQRDTRGGAAQDRQRSRTSLHERIRDVQSILHRVMQNINPHRRGRKVPIFIIAGLAGGTGSGTFLDIATLAIKLAASTEMFGQSFMLFGLFFLPAAFEPVLRTDKEKVQAPVNTFAALRELERYLKERIASIGYDNPIGAINVREVLLGRNAEALGGRLRPFDTVYLIDGTRYAEDRAVEPITHIEPQYGVFPAVADFLFAHVDGARGIDYTNLSADAGRQDAFYSACGSYSLIFDVKEVIRTLAHPLALQALDHFLVTEHITEGHLLQEAGNFLQRTVDAPYNTSINQKLDDTRSRARWDRRSLLEAIALGKDEQNRNRDKPLPSIDFFREAQAISWRNSAELRRFATQAEERRRKCMDQTADLIEYYKAEHKRLFWKYIEERLIEERRLRIVEEEGRKQEREEIKPGLLKENDGRGGLWHAERFLEILSQLYSETAERFMQWMHTRNYPREISAAQDRAQSGSDSWQARMLKVTRFERIFGSGGDVKGFCDAMDRLLELQQEQMIAQAAKEIFESLRDICRNLLRDISIWRNTFESGKTAIINGLAELAAYRREKTRVVVRRYVTEPPQVNKQTGAWTLDRVEQQLFNEFLQSHQEDYKQKVLDQFDWTIEPPGQYHPTDPEEWQGRRHLRSVLPDEFAPWHQLREDAERWNYQFQQNLIQMGFFNGLKDRVDIFEVLHRKEEERESVTNELVNQSTPLLSFSANLQRSKGVDPSNARWFHIWSSFGMATGDSATLAREIEDQLRAQSGQPQTLTGLRHEISAIQARHLFVVEAIPQYREFEREYRKLQRACLRARKPEDAEAQPHVFLEERNAVELEMTFTEVPHDGPKDLRYSEEPLLEPAVVSCLTDETFLLNVALALWQGWLRVEPDPADPLRIRHAYVMASGREIVVGGENPFEALVHFHTNPNIDVSDARRDLQERAAALRREKQQQGKQAVADFIKETEQKAFESLLPSGVLDTQPEMSQLDQVLRLLLWRNAQKQQAFV